MQYCKLPLNRFLKLPEDKISDLIIKYLVQKKVSRSSKKVIFATIKHACEINDVILNWKKIKRFIGSEKTGNEIVGKDRGYTHEEKKHDKLLTSLRTAYAEELNLKKEQTSYDDLLDALRLALKGYEIE